MHDARLMVLIFGLLGGVSLDAPIFAQTPPPRAPAMASIPMALPLGKVPVGRWAEYRMADGSGKDLSLKLVVVAHKGKLSDVETVLIGGTMAPLGRTVMRSSINNDTGADAHPDLHVVQMGDNPPMAIPMQIAGGPTQNFRKLDPKQRLGTESLTVVAGTFPRAEHYQERMASGEVVNYWVSGDVPPFGLVKLQAGVDAQGKPLVLELVAHGGNAKALITAPLQPYDRTALAKQLQPLIAAQQTATAAAAAANRPGPTK